MSSDLLEYSTSNNGWVAEQNVTNETLTHEATDDEKLFERLVSIILPIIFGLIAVIGLIGNLLVIIVVISNKQMRNTTNILIISLALADLSFIVFCVPFTAAGYALPTWPFGDVWCKIVNYLMFVCAYASVYTLVLMSLDRYLAVVHPIRSMAFRTEKNAYIAVTLVWILIIGANVPTLFLFTVITYSYANETRSKCLSSEFLENPDKEQMFYGFFLAFGYVLPLALVCVLYGFMLKRLLYGVVPGGSQSAESIRTKKRVTRMVIIVVVIFALCWLPIQIIFVMQVLGLYPEKIPFFWIKMAANCLSYMNSCVNPILYAFLSENFRKSFRKILFCLVSSSVSYDYERTHIRNSETTYKSQAV